MKIYLNGDFVDANEAKVSIFDAGFLYGAGLFETMRAYNGTIFALDRHLDRLTTAARILEFPSIPSAAELQGVCNEVITVNKLSDARVRLTVSWGESAYDHATVAISASPYSGYERELYENGMSAITLPGYRCSNTLLATVKSTSYFASVLARKEAVATGCDEALLTNEHSHITEGSISNVFAVVDGVISTPRVADGLLPGVTREVVIEVIADSGYELIQRSIHKDELFRFDELFLTNSLMEIMPLTQVDGNRIGAGSPGQITIDISRHFKGYVRTTI
ncbi:MAG TPA: aminotransferase class IV [Candidatus Aquicultor sp.]|jgi:branched-chain amino acid aminotransferase group I